MPNRIAWVLIITICFLATISCKQKNNESLVCTMEFRMVNIKINGPILDTFYTVRLSTGDTIRPISGRQFFENTYSVLDDNYQPQLINTQDSFRFYGIIQNQQVVNELFTIKADRCHIDYVNGRTEITL